MTDIVKTSQGRESGHWYDKNGHLIELVTGAKGQHLKPDLSHARKLDLAPGVTTILKMAAAPGLEIWKQNKVLMSALTTTRFPSETDEAFIWRIKAEAAAEARAAAEAGTALHAEIERGIAGGEKSPLAQVAIDKLVDLVGAVNAPWHAERGAVSTCGYGTKSDACLAGGLFTDHSWIIDWKGTEKPLSELKTFKDHARQLAATRMGLTQSVDPAFYNARCAIGYVRRDYKERDIKPTSAIKLIEVGQDELTKGWLCFYHLLQLWQIDNDYRPSWATDWRDNDD